VYRDRHGMYVAARYAPVLDRRNGRVDVR
jgi:hypothetical protein